MAQDCGVKVGDRVAFSIFGIGRFFDLLPFRGIVTRTGDDRIWVLWPNHGNVELSYHPRDLILTDRIHMEELP